MLRQGGHAVQSWWPRATELTREAGLDAAIHSVTKTLTILSRAPGILTTQEGLTAVHSHLLIVLE